MNKSVAADKVIDSHVLWAMGAGAVPIPVIDIVAVGAIQLNMFKELCLIYDVDYSESFGKNLISSIAGASLAKIGASFVKSIPGIGTLLGGVPMVVLSGTSTYAIGQVFKKHLEIGGIMSAFSFDSAQKVYNDAYESGKQYVQDLYNMTTGKKAESKKPDEEAKESKNQKQSSQRDIFKQIETLAELRDKGILTEEEFQAKKAKLLEEI